jgi:hypothetical protein
MHHSATASNRSVTLICYVDDSGTEEQSELVMTAGCLLNRESFLRFHSRWERMLNKYRLNSLHMTDFVRPQGAHVGMYSEFKVALFSEAVKIINSRKTYSISVSVKNADFKKAISVEFYRKVLAPYAAAFVALCLLNAKNANAYDYPERIAYVVDEGSPFAEQLRVAHLIVRAYEKGCGLAVRTGSLTFADDAMVSALQAADLVAWSARRKFSGTGLINEFSPLNAVFEERFNAYGAMIHPHFHYSVQDDLTQKIMEQINANGPALQKESADALLSLLGDECK